MNELWREALSWLAYLQRPVVLQQVLTAGLAVALVRRLLPARPRRPEAGRGLAVLGALLLLIAMLALAAQPHGLVVLFAQLTAAWLALRALESGPLQRWLDQEACHRLVSRLIRPGFLLLVLLVLLNAVTNLPDLGAIVLGGWFGKPVTLGRLFLAVVVLYALVMGSQPPVAALGWMVQRGIGISSGSRRAIEVVLRYILVGLGILWALDFIGFDRTGIIAIAGGLSVGIGFGIKEVVSNFISGIWLLFEGSVRPGEILIIDGQPCEVRRLGMRAATLWRKSDNAELVIPNQTFFTSTTATFTRTDRTRRCSFAIALPCDQRPKEILELLESLGSSHPLVLALPPPRASVLDYGKSVVSYELAYTIADPLASVQVGSELRVAVWDALEQRGVELS